MIYAATGSPLTILFAEGGSDGGRPFLHLYEPHIGAKHFVYISAISNILRQTPEGEDFLIIITKFLVFFFQVSAGLRLLHSHSGTCTKLRHRGRGLQKEYDDDYKLCSCVCSKKGKRGQIRDQKILHHKWRLGILPPSLSLSFF